MTAAYLKTLLNSTLLVTGTLIAVAQDHPPATIPDSEVRYLKSPYGRQQEYEISVALPQGYRTSDNSYPVLYVLDSNGQFGTVTEAARALATYDLSIPHMIVVGVGYPVGIYFNTQHHRQLDYTPTRSEEWETIVERNYPKEIVTGGGPEFRQFIEEALIPFIDLEYRTLANDRCICGYSQGGLFAFNTLIDQPNLFQRYIIGSPNLGYDDGVTFKKEQEFAIKNKTLSARLFLSSEGDDALKDWVLQPTRRMVATLKRRNYTGLDWTHHIFDGETHDSAIGATINRGLRAVYDPPYKDREYWTDPSPHKSHFLELDGYRLNYLDWGGSGKNLVFVPGLGDSPHIFDDLAPKFTDRYRVVSYARRGHGQSTSPPNAKYDMDTLTEDLRMLIDSLDIESASLVGFSMGGLEINRFAVLYPDRVEKLIYLDGAYDYSGPLRRASDVHNPVRYSPTPEDLASTQALYQWFLTKGYRKGLPDSNALRADVAATSKPAPNGGVELIVDGDFQAALFKSVTSYPREFDVVDHPSLAIFAIKHAPHIVPEGSDSEVLKKVDDWLKRYAHPWQRACIEKFRSEAPDGRVVELSDTHHVVFLHRPERVAQEMNTFLNED